MRVSKELRRNQRNFAGTVNLTSPPCGSNVTIATISAMGLSRTALRSIVGLEKMASG
jgi:ornithine cyclodeaminase/alanine dehydrogenase-like protein (mu-crystallin family)